MASEEIQDVIKELKTLSLGKTTKVSLPSKRSLDEAKHNQGIFCDFDFLDFIAFHRGYACFVQREVRNG